MLNRRCVEAPFALAIAVSASLGCGGDGDRDSSERGLQSEDAGETSDASRPDGSSEHSDSRDGGFVVMPLPELDGSFGTSSDSGEAQDADEVVDGDAAMGDSAVGGDPLDAGPPLSEDDLPYARSVAEFSPGANAGFGQASYPDNVLGPPMGLGTGGGSLDVLSLGVGGEIVLDFGVLRIVDEPGPDFIVFENPFWPGGNSAQVFAELGEVSVSEDGETWHTFTCDVQGTGAGQFPGCAGWTPTLRYDPLEVFPLDPDQTGGDAFDLQDLAVTSARFVRVRDLSSSGTGTSGGFDLDAVGLVHFEAE